VSELPIDVQNPLTDAEQGITKKCIICEEWFKENPYHEPEDYAHDYRTFCERRMKALMELIRDKVA
jgi:hypothetical protein